MSNISYNKLNQPGAQQVLKDVSEACQALHIDFFIIGALARNIWHIKHQKRPVGTADLDFAIYIPSPFLYQDFTQLLKSHYKYKSCGNNAYCFLAPNQKQIDLLPFAAPQIKDGIFLEGKGHIQPHLEGLYESYKLGLEPIHIEKDRFNICSIPAIVVLKLIAFDDRPEHRSKDARDINSILLHYPFMEEERIWLYHNDLYTDNREHEEVGVMALGREMHAIISQNTHLMRRMEAIIDKALKQKSQLLKHMIINPEHDTIATKAHLLQNLHFGLSSEREV